MIIQPNSVLKTGDFLEGAVMELIQENLPAIYVIGTVHTAATVGLISGAGNSDLFNKTGDLFKQVFPIDYD